MVYQNYHFTTNVRGVTNLGGTFQEYDKHLRHDFALRSGMRYPW